MLSSRAISLGPNSIATYDHRRVWLSLNIEDVMAFAQFALDRFSLATGFGRQASP